MQVRNGRVMVPLYAARIEDLGPVDFMAVELCPERHHTH